MLAVAAPARLARPPVSRRLSFGAVSDVEEIWVPLVDEPIGAIVAQIQADDPEIDALVGSPRRLLAFRRSPTSASASCSASSSSTTTSPPYDGSDTWVDALLRDPAHREALGAEVRAVAEEIAADPRYADDERLGPDDAARERFRAFARQQLERSAGPRATEADARGRRRSRPPSADALATTGARARAAAGRSRP